MPMSFKVMLYVCIVALCFGTATAILDLNDPGEEVSAQHSASHSPIQDEEGSFNVFYSHAPDNTTHPAASASPLSGKKDDHAASPSPIEDEEPFNVFYSTSPKHDSASPEKKDDHHASPSPQEEKKDDHHAASPSPLEDEEPFNVFYSRPPKQASASPETKDDHHAASPSPLEGKPDDHHAKSPSPVSDDEEFNVFFSRPHTQASASPEKKDDHHAASPSPLEDEEFNVFFSKSPVREPSASPEEHHHPAASASPFSDEEEFQVFFSRPAHESLLPAASPSPGYKVIPLVPVPPHLDLLLSFCLNNVYEVPFFNASAGLTISLTCDTPIAATLPFTFSILRYLDSNAASHQDVCAAIQVSFSGCFDYSVDDVCQAITNDAKFQVANTGAGTVNVVAGEKKPASPSPSSEEDYTVFFSRPASPQPSPSAEEDYTVFFSRPTSASPRPLLPRP